MGTQNDKNAKAAESTVDKDQPTPDQVKAADDSVTETVETSVEHPQEPATVTEESAQETADRHVASTEMPVEKVTPVETQAGLEDLDDEERAEALESLHRDPSNAYGLKIPGAAVGPDHAGVVRNDEGKVAFAPPGTHNAAMAGVQMDASGHVDSVGTDNSSKSNTRI